MTASNRLGGDGLSFPVGQLHEVAEKPGVAALGRDARRGPVEAVVGVDRLSADGGHRRAGGSEADERGEHRVGDERGAEQLVRLPARSKIEGLPEGFRFHDPRHYPASLLIVSGLDVEVVQHRLRHGSAKTTLDTYGHLWPDSDESARAAIGAVLAARADSVRTSAELERSRSSAPGSTQMS